MATKIRRTLFIGLGGTGMNALLHTKKMLYDTYGEIPPMLGFLGIDTDGGVYNKSLPAKDGTLVTLTTSEQLPICVKSPSDIYLRAPGNFSWIPAENASALTALNIGAGQVRSNGRFALTIHEDDVVNSVNAKLRQIRSAAIIDNPDYALLSSEPEIHMVFSLGGGTGCGTFINMAYLLQRAVPDVKLSGYAVMADVFRAMMQGAGMARVRPNAMGAIRDLDYLMHLSPASEPVEIKWLRESQMVYKRPFTAFYFIDNCNANGDTFSNVDQLCEMISLALVMSTGELSVAAASISDNVAKQISDGTMDICNKKGWAAGFGVSEIVFNGAILSQIYGQKARRQIIARMRNGGCDDPSVIANAWFDNTRIRENLGKDDVTDFFMPAASPRSFTDIDSPENPRVEVNHFLDNAAMEPQEKLNEKLDELKNRVDLAMSALMTEQANRECGIYLCENVLHAINTQIEYCDAEMKSEGDNLRVQLARLESSLESTCKELSEATGIFSRGKRRKLTEEVCERTMAVARCRREIKRREMAREFYTWLRTRVATSFDRVNTIISNLQAVNDASTREIEKLVRAAANGNFFQNDLAADEAEKVACPMSDIVFGDFAKYMKETYGGIQAMAQMSANETGQSILDFVAGLPQAKAYAAKTVDQALDAMDADSFHRLCMRAMQKSMPLFSYAYRGFDADVKDRPVDNYYVGVADKSTSRLARGGYMQELATGGCSLQFTNTGIKDRVIIYRQIGVVPPFTITAIDNYIPEYERFESQKEFTCHWDADLCRRMRKERYDLAPRDVVSTDRAVALWTFAIVAGFISRDAARDVYQIRSHAMGGKPLSGYKVTLGQSRPEAFAAFCDNLDVLEPELDKARARVGMPGEDTTLLERFNAARKSVDAGTYLAEFSLCPYTLGQLEDSRLEETANLLNEEMTYISQEL